jgi:hypothetical protein
MIRFTTMMNTRAATQHCPCRRPFSHSCAAWHCKNRTRGGHHAWLEGSLGLVGCGRGNGCRSRRAAFDPQLLRGSGLQLGADDRREKGSREASPTWPIRRSASPSKTPASAICASSPTTSAMAFPDTSATSSSFARTPASRGSRTSRARCLPPTRSAPAWILP